MITPIDGFTVERVGDMVVLILSNRYGEGEQYEFGLEDSRRIGEGLVFCASEPPPASAPA